MSVRIPATIVTGFLGAGKTSLLRHLVRHAGGKRLAFVINEFGELGIDRELLLGCADCAPGYVVELANGCICCAIADDFLPAIEKLLAADPRPDHIVVETSGLALPKPLIKAFAWPTIRTRVTVDGVIAMIDAGRLAAGDFAAERVRAGDHDNPLEEVFGDQLAAADLVVLNKTDLLNEVEYARLQAELRAKLRRGAKLLGAREGALPVAVALGLGAAAEDDLESRPSHADALGEHDHDDFESFAIDLSALTRPDDFIGRLTEAIAAHEVLRAKGFAEVAGKPLRLAIQAVGARVDSYFDRPWHAGETRRGRLVVIGRKGLDRGAIAAALGAAGVAASATRAAD